MYDFFLVTRSRRLNPKSFRYSQAVDSCIVTPSSSLRNVTTVCKCNSSHLKFLCKMKPARSSKSNASSSGADPTPLQSGTASPVLSIRCNQSDSVLRGTSNDASRKTSRTSSWLKFLSTTSVSSTAPKAFRTSLLILLHSYISLLRLVGKGPPDILFFFYFYFFFSDHYL